MNSTPSLESLANDFVMILHSMSTTEWWKDENQASYFGYVQMQTSELVARWDSIKEVAHSLRDLGICFDLLQVALVENALAELADILRSEEDSEEPDLKEIADKVDSLYRVWFAEESSSKISSMKARNSAS